MRDDERRGTSGFRDCPASLPAELSPIGEKNRRRLFSARAPPRDERRSTFMNVAIGLQPSLHRVGELWSSFPRPLPAERELRNLVSSTLPRCVMLDQFVESRELMIGHVTV